MPNKWKTHKLGEILDVKQGLAINKKTDHLLTDKSSMPLFKIRDLINNTVEHYVKEDKVPRQCIANYEDLIYSRTGQVGLVFRGRIGCIHNNCFKIIPNETIVNKDLLFWFLKQPEIIEYANNIASGSVQKDLNHTAFKSIEISISDNVNEQKKIAEIFNDVNDKIENNLAINKTLEEMAMALYKHWFVDFGPFQDGEFVENELGMIPKDWEVKRLDELADFINGYAFKSGDLKNDNDGNSYHIFKMGHIERGGGLKENATKSFINKSKCEKLEKYILKVGDLLMAMTDMKDNVAILGNTALINENDKYIVNQRVGLIRPKNDKGIDYSFLYLTTNENSFIERLRSQANSGVQVNLSTDAIKSAKMIIGSKEINLNFNDIVKPLYNNIFQNKIENQTLTQLRDTLLPKLISGEVRLKEFREKLEV
jgi:type I restriction enzyme S subunit